MDISSCSRSPKAKLPPTKVASSVGSARIFHIAENSQTDDEVFEKIISEMQDGSWTIDEKGAVIGPWLTEALDELDHGEDSDEQRNENNKHDEGNGEDESHMVKGKKERKSRAKA
ncbi:hypothetical protein E2P81_ATG08844 [Venturia nashicola]|uniref:Uncharacterized protein n=1 Tax=Venturia nashicola TaxID=86259 RepID=A0A4Z1NML0_9PEZI|nr:hypothetical protein E6O75_ATG09041 [Venturia nashicola]TLD23500.1 hypothetical protein E2P81_ATG08844 [Venturia nashicola]